MHISLDSALGRQRRLNSVGESVLQIAPDAAAAYSLRSLTGGDPDVVRVRRESDNTEKDFSGSQIESGEMARWVNEQPTLPLDLRELDTNTGERDGALIEAAAAYSLRKLKEDFTGDVVEVRRNVDGETEGFTADEVTDGTLESFVNASFDDELPLDQATGAAAAYSLRNLKASGTDVTTSGDTAGDTSGKYVVQVRRSSDDAVKSFTASEVADGTLEAWVNADIVTYESDFSAGVDGWASTRATADGNIDGIGGKDDNLRGTVDGTADASHTIQITSIGETVGLTYDVSLEVYIPSSNSLVDGYQIRFGEAAGVASDASPDLDSWVTVNFTKTVVSTIGLYVYPTDGGDVSFTGNGTDVFYVRNIQVTQTTADGHVRTWYDQSGSGNNAVQTTDAKQPKIVEGGTLVADGIKFDGVDDHLDIASGVFSVANSADKTLIVVSKSDVTGAGVRRQLFLGAGNGTRISLWKTSDTSNAVSFNGFANGVTNTFDNTNTFLAYAEDLSGTQNFYINGGNLQTNALGGTNNDVNTAEISNDINAQHWSGIQSEIIIYDSDQSDKRRAIEENIANHYDISLAAFSRDGTVSTWYDQSGNTNDAVQTDAAKQPKIVIDGDLVTGGIDFNGAEFLSRSSFTQGDLEQPNTTFSVAKLDSNDDTNRKVYDGKTGDGRNMLLLSPTDLGQFGIYSGSVLLTGDIATSDKHLFTALYNSTSSEFFIDGTSEASGDAGDYSMDAIVIGANHDKASNFWLGQIQEIIIYNSNQSANRTAIEANIGETYGITAIPAANDTVNGFVQAWYDQSGSGNDAEQTTAANQPKIVSAGVLVTNGGKPALKFDGTSHRLELSAKATIANTSIFSAFRSNSNSQDSVLFHLAVDGSNVVSIGLGNLATGSELGSRLRVGGVNLVSVGDNTFTSTSQSLLSYIASSSAAKMFVDSTEETDIVDSRSSGPNSRIGARGDDDRFFNGDISEVVLYDIDQSANRTAIETNIANQYGITLS